MTEGMRKGDDDREGRHLQEGVGLKARPGRDGEWKLDLSFENCLLKIEETVEDKTS